MSLVAARHGGTPAASARAWGVAAVPLLVLEVTAASAAAAAVAVAGITLAAASAAAVAGAVYPACPCWALEKTV